EPDGARGMPGTAAPSSFTGNTDIVTLDGNGADNPQTMTAYTPTVGDAIGALADLPSDAAWPTLSGSALSGWNTAANGSGTDVDASTSTSASGQTVYAQWTSDAQMCAATFQQEFINAA